MQKEKTLQFWDDYHKENESKEWILQPSLELLEFLRSQCPCTNSRATRTLSLLEIGCGTSTLARELWKHIVAYDSSDDEQRTVHMCASDVSQACIRVNTERDASLILVQNNNDGNNKDKHSLKYRTLDVIKPDSSLMEEDVPFHVILDKGCLDTFMFRSKNRGGGGKPDLTLLRTVLDNIFSWMSDDGGIYLIISPRSKIKAIRDYNGFKSVQRHALPTMKRGDLEGKGNNKNNNTPGYVFICQKDTQYVIGQSPPFKGKEWQEEFPKDDDRCPSCTISFIDLRKGEAVEGRGSLFWSRQWKGHCLHCKLPPKTN